MVVAALFLACLQTSTPPSQTPKPAFMMLSVYRLLPQADLDLESSNLVSKGGVMTAQVDGEKLARSIDQLVKTQEIRLVAAPKIYSLVGFESMTSVSGGQDSFTLRCQPTEIEGASSIRLALKSKAVNAKNDPTGFLKAALSKAIRYSETNPAVYILKEGKEPYWLVVAKPGKPVDNKNGTGGLRSQ
jgi:hypothetical protein